MRIAIILNGISRQKNKVKRKMLPMLRKHFSVEVFETTSKDDAYHFASNAVENGFDYILAAGGDGTLHQVLNGLLAGKEKFFALPMLGLIPIGTGNDFARTLGLKNDIQVLIKSILEKKSRNIDVGKIHFTNPDSGLKESRYFVNVADAGMGPDVVRRIANQRSVFGIPYSYFIAILKTFFNYQLIQMKVKTESWSWHGKARAIAVANGQYFGQGLCIAPDANPNDQEFSTFICGNVSVFDFIRYSIPLKKGKKIVHQEVRYDACKHMELVADEPCGVEADGEYLGMLPARVEMMTSSIQFLI